MNITSKENFEKKYTETNFITNWLIKNFYKNLANLVKNKNIDSVLEVGCGHGFSTQYLRNFFPTQLIEASDYEQNLVDDAKIKNPDINIKRESIYDLQRSDNSFDLVVCLEVLEHLDNPDEALRELARVTNNFCLLSVPNEPLWRLMNLMRGKYIKDFGNTPGHINHWSRARFLDLLSKYFKIIDYKQPVPWNMVLVAKK
ncbi:MAG: hypothetical protein UR94_C0001G0016 [Parcubacteria group bacterium GW2011_GWA2_36_10]|nr:MAG: hypothetical protein UR94_C0001G0016 [Parcubacteria group bacterium GW2011_GWA2_36_10]